ncbi:hypothetical protein AB0E04_37150 [Streptomyces sp. NPDC048251]
MLVHQLSFVDGGFACARGPVRDGHVPGGGEEFAEPGGVEVLSPMNERR